MCTRDQGQFDTSRTSSNTSICTRDLTTSTRIPTTKVLTPPSIPISTYQPFPTTLLVSNKSVYKSHLLTKLLYNGRHHGKLFHDNLWQCVYKTVALRTQFRRICSKTSQYLRITHTEFAPTFSKFSPTGE